jgi:hypothetical protein
VAERRRGGIAALPGLREKLPTNQVARAPRTDPSTRTNSSISEVPSVIAPSAVIRTSSIQAHQR